jgi:DNA-directed RNA polymerase specialized sigma24 family protein
MTSTEQHAARDGPNRRSIAEQKAAIGRMSSGRLGEMGVLAKRLIRRYRLKLLDWGPEDAVQDALHALSLAADNDDLGAVASDDDLWKLFHTTLDNQVINAIKRGSAIKRDGTGTSRDRQWAEGVAAPRKSRRGFQRVDRDLDQSARDSLSHEEELASREAVERLLDRLGHPVLRSIAVYCQEGRTFEEIAGILGASTRTVERKFKTIRELFSELNPDRRKVRSTRG